MLIGFTAQSVLALNAAGAMICCDPETKAMMQEHIEGMSGSNMSDDVPCHDTELSCETCCMDAISQTLMIDRSSPVSFPSTEKEQKSIQSDQIPNSIAADYIPPPPNT